MSGADFVVAECGRHWRNLCGNCSILLRFFSTQSAIHSECSESCFVWASFIMLETFFFYGGYYGGKKKVSFLRGAFFSLLCVKLHKRCSICFACYIWQLGVLLSTEWLDIDWTHVLLRSYPINWFISNSKSGKLSIRNRFRDKFQEAIDRQPHKTKHGVSCSVDSKWRHECKFVHHAQADVSWWIWTHQACSHMPALIEFFYRGRPESSFNPPPPLKSLHRTQPLSPSSPTAF